MSTRLVVICSTASCIAIFLFVTLVNASSPQLFDGSAEPPASNTSTALAANPTSDDKNGLSDAGRLGEIQESLESDQKQLRSLEQ